MSPPPAEQVRELARQVLADEQFARGEGQRALLDYFFDALKGLTGLQDSSPVLFWTLMAAMMLVLLAIFAHAGWVVYRAIGPVAARRDPGRGQARRRRGGDPAAALGAARERAAAGDYRWALPLLYLSLLFELDRRGLLRLELSETNREAASQLRRAESRQPARRLAAMADRALYSRRAAFTEQDFRRGLELHHRVLETAS